MHFGGSFRIRRSIVAALVLGNFASRAVTARSLAAEESAFVLRSEANQSVRLTASDFKKLPRTEIEAIDHHGNKGRYAGVTVRALLDRLGVPQGEKVRGKWLGFFVIVEATDNYRAVFGLAELDPSLSDRTILLADTRDGQPLGGKQGPFQIIAPGDKRPARWVRMVREIRLVDSRRLKD